MSKAILVIDMPDNCDKCPCFQFGMDNYCAVTDKTVYNYRKERHVDCPLIPAPEEQEVWFDDERSDWERGYNNCVREIVGRK